ncbi:hypothetical protein Ddc_07057 [Ditylenchus destructor]|nr:hypothetical protein Ddc_07057 [Ditylenchus destructor]
MKAKMTKGGKTTQKDDNSKLREQLEAMSWNELRAEAKTHGIKVTGKEATNEKANITINREEVARTENANNKFREQLEALSWNDLRKEAKSRGVKTGGKAVDLIERILEQVQQNAGENADETIEIDGPDNTSVSVPSTDQLAVANEPEQSNGNNPNLRSKQVRKEKSLKEESNANATENGDPLNTTFTIETNVADPDEKQGSFLTEDNSPAPERKSRKRSTASFLSNDKSASQLHSTGKRVSTTPANEISKIQSPNAAQTPATSNRSKLKDMISSSTTKCSSSSVMSPSKALSQNSFLSSDNSFCEVTSAKRKTAGITTNKSNLNSTSPNPSKSLAVKKTLTTPKDTISTSTRTPRSMPIENRSISKAENISQASFLTNDNNGSESHPSTVMQMDLTPENLSGTKLTSLKTHSGLLGSAILNSAVSRRSTSTRISTNSQQSQRNTEDNCIVAENTQLNVSSKLGTPTLTSTPKPVQLASSAPRNSSAKSRPASTKVKGNIENCSTPITANSSHLESPKKSISNDIKSANSSEITSPVFGEHKNTLISNNTDENIEIRSTPAGHNQSGSLNASTLNRLKISTSAASPVARKASISAQQSAIIANESSHLSTNNCSTNFDSGRRSILTRVRKSASTLTPAVDEPPAKTPRLSRKLEEKTENVPTTENNHSVLISPRNSTTKSITTTTSPSIANVEEESLMKTPQQQDEIENHSLDLKMSLSGNRRSRVSSPRKSVRNRIQTPYHVSKAVNVSSSRISRSSKKLHENVQNSTVEESCQSDSVSLEASANALDTSGQGEESTVSTPSGNFRSQGTSSLKRTRNSASKASPAVTESRNNVEDGIFATDINQGSNKQSTSGQRSTRKSVSFASPFASPARGSLTTTRQTPGKPNELAEIDLATNETSESPEDSQKNASTSKGILGLNRFAKQHEKHFGLMPSILDTEAKLKERHAKNSAVPDYVKRLASPKKTIVNRSVSRKSPASVTPTLDEPPTKVRRSSVNRKEIAENTASISENRPSKLVQPRKILRECNSTHSNAATFDEPVAPNELSFKFGDAEVSDMPKIQRPFKRSTTGFVSRLRTPKPVSVKKLTMRTPQENSRTPTVRLATEPVMSERLERLATPKNMNSGNRSMLTKSAEVRKYTPYTGRFMYKDTSKMSAKELVEYNRYKRENPNSTAQDFFHSSQ